MRYWTSPWTMIAQRLELGEASDARRAFEWEGDPKGWGSTRITCAGVRHQDKHRGQAVFVKPDFGDPDRVRIQ